MKKPIKKATVELEVCKNTLRNLRTLVTALEIIDDGCLKEVESIDDKVKVRLSLSKDALVGLWKLAANRKITVDSYLEELLVGDVVPALEQLHEAEQNKSKIVKFPLQ